MKQLFQTMVRPHLEYGNVVWNPLYKKDINLIESVQRRATRLIPGMEGLSYEQRLRHLDMPSLMYRRYRGDAIDVYKHLHSIYKVNSTSLLPLSTSQTTRGHSLKLAKRYCNTQARAHFFGMRITNVWNGLPDEVVMAPSLNTFKNRIDRCWKQYMYKTAPDDFAAMRTTKFEFELSEETMKINQEAVRSYDG